MGRMGQDENLPFAKRRGRVRSTQGMHEIQSHTPKPQQRSPLPLSGRGLG